MTDPFSAPGAGEGDAGPTGTAAGALRGLGCLQLVLGVGMAGASALALLLLVLMAIEGEFSTSDDAFLGGIVFLGAPALACGPTSLGLFLAGGAALALPRPITSDGWLRAVQGQVLVWVVGTVAFGVALTLFVGAFAWAIGNEL